MKTVQLFTAILIAAATFGPAAAQDPQERIEAALERARAQGLPVQLLQSKMAEGIAKNVPLGRIAFALEQRAAAMARAADVLAGVLENQPVPTEDIAVGADALQAGVEETALARVAGGAGHERRTVAIAALTQLVAGGAQPEDALRIVEAAMARGDQALMNLPGMAGQMAGQGGPPAGMPPAGKPGGAGPPTGTPGGPPGGGGPPSGGS